MFSCTAKRAIYRIAVCALAVLVMGGCINQGADDAATITLQLSSGIGRAADDDTLAGLIFIVDFSGPSTFSVGPTAPGTRTINVSVSPGYYVITAAAFLDGELYAKGSTTAQAQAGNLTQATLTLYHAGANDIVIDISAIEGVTAPVTGETPVTEIEENDQFSGTVTWLPDHSKFVAATKYTATISLTAKPGYTLFGVEAGFFKVTGGLSTGNLANSGIVTAVFPITAGTATAPAKIDIYEITGVTVPVTGGIPVKSIKDNAQYTGTVTWLPNDSKFDALTEYTATITLTAKTGFTLQGVDANFFKVEGAISVSNAADSGVVTAMFNKTYIDTTINFTAIAGVAAPATGENPVTSIPENDQYTGTVEWKTASGASLTGAFASATQYTATITLTPKTGYTSQGVTVDLFTVAGALSVKNSADSGVITAVFPKTYTTIGMANITGVTAPINGVTPVTYINETPQYTGTVSWKTADGNVHTSAFADYNTYTAVITLTPKDGYTFQGVAVNFFTVAGASSINSANSGIITATFPQIPYALGGTGPGGGKIFYYDADGFTVQGYGNLGDPGYFATYTAHFLEAAPSGSGQLAWASDLSTNISGTDTALGTGRKNTALILATDSDAPAAKACAEYSNRGLTDWFLPSKEELDLLYDNRFYVGNLGNASYYCSSGSRILMFQLEDLWRPVGKDEKHYVRAIRAF